MIPRDVVCIQERRSLQNKMESRAICGTSKLGDKGVSTYAREAGVLAEFTEDSWSGREEPAVTTKVSCSRSHFSLWQQT